MLHRRPGRSLKLAAFGPQNDPLDRFDRATTLPLGGAGRASPHSNFNKISAAK
jgi:hypothetical protein